MKDKINEAIALTKFKGVLTVVHTQVTDEKPHPFCIGPKHIKRYHMDFHAGPCVMRVNPNDPTKYSNKRVNKEGITGTCGLSFEEHTFKVQVLFQLHQDLKAQELEDALQQGMEMKSLFDKFFIQGFAFIKTEPQFNLI